MTIQEIQQLQVGNLIMIGEDDNAMIAIVDRVTRLIPAICKDVNQVVRLYEGHYLDFEDMKGGGVGWCTSDNPEFNEKIRPMAPEHFHGIPIPPNFEEINGVHLWNDPKAVETYEFVHKYQNEWNHYEGIKEDWKLK